MDLKEPGFFVEAGALDGETRSNTLQLERKHGWEGVLIEADKTSLFALKEKHRKAWILPNCISTQNHTIVAEFANKGHVGKIKLTKDKVGQSATQGLTDVVCLPLYSIVSALGRKRIDFFSLDVEGFELEVLKTVPFDQLDIKVSHKKLKKNKTFA